MELKHKTVAWSSENVQTLNNWYNSGGGIPAGHQYTFTVISQGDDNTERTGRQVQLRSVEFRGVLNTAEQDVTVRWALVRLKGPYASVTEPRTLLWSASAANGAITTAEWNNPIRRQTDDTHSTAHWSSQMKILKMGMFEMPTTKLSRNIHIKAKWSIGKRPIVSYESETSTTANRNGVYLIFWASEEFGTGPDTGAQLTNVVTDTSWYDA